MSTAFLSLLTAAWLTVVSLGTGVLLIHDYTPGTDVSIPGLWPSQSQIQRLTSRPTLIMFAHPDCPCTRASIGELMVLMTHCQKQVDAHVIFLQPRGSTEEWLHTDLWKSAEAIPGVAVTADRDGQEMKRFRATTSGRVLLYDAHGILLFEGGITASRGHYGDNAGLTSLIHLLRHETATATETPAFGCSLVNPMVEGSEAFPCTR
jgi:hypothetical protein